MKDTTHTRYKRARKARKLSRPAVATAADSHRNTVMKLERGELAALNLVLRLLAPVGGKIIFEAPSTPPRRILRVIKGGD